MIWVKSILAGIVSALLTTVAIVLATTVWFISITRGSGAGGIGAVSAGVIELLLLPAALAFALGFFWMVRRQQRSLTRSTRPTSPTTPTRMAP